MCYCPTPTLHLNLALTGDGAFLLPPQKTHTVWFISILNYGDTENVLINHLLLVIPMSYPCYYTNLCPHKPHKHAHTQHTHTMYKQFYFFYLFTLKLFLKKTNSVCLYKLMGTKKYFPQGQGFCTFPSLWGHIDPIMYSIPESHTHSSPSPIISNSNM